MNWGDGPKQERPARLVWFDIPVTDLERASRFYTSLFHWTFTPFEAYDPNYWIIHGDEGEIGALVLDPSATEKSGGTVLFMEVADLDESLSHAQSLGAALERSRTRITSGAGAFAIVRDPDGNPVGLWCGGGGDETRGA